MRKVSYEKIEAGKPVVVKALFHQWGLDTNESGAYTVALLELSNGEIITLPPTWIKFLEPPQ